MYVSLSLRVVATDGTEVIYAPASVQHIHLAANPGTQPFRASRITQVIVYDAGGSPATIVVAQYTGANTLYEYGFHTTDGIWNTVFSNR